MCGILGTHNRNIDIMPYLKRLEHRGPDNIGVEREGHTIHGHVRLSIIDTNPRSNQPFRYNNSLLSFNGEIWNYKELRNILIEKGRKFHTESDTEVLIQALDYWYVGALKLLDGMFSFVYTNSDTGRNIIVRDVYGKIPIYINKQGNTYMWSSERKAAQIGWNSLPPGTYLDLTENKIVSYYSFPNSEQYPPEDLHELLKRAVKKRMIQKWLLLVK